MTVEHNVDLAPFTTFGVAAHAATMVTVFTIEELQQAVVDYPDARILGGGSNLLVINDQETVIRNQIAGIREQGSEFSVGAGEAWHAFVSWAVDHDLGGLENLALIPGTAGAAPMQNIGAYGVEQESCFVELQAVERATGNLVTFAREACAFGYRTSIFKTAPANQYVIASVTYRLSKPPHTIHAGYKDVAAHLADVPEPGIRDVFDAVVAIRTAKLPDPKVIGNAGSFFKNPVVTTEHYTHLLERFPELPSYPANAGHVKLPAAWLIDRAGWKGFREGAVGVHERQALVLVNHGGAHGADVLRLAERIRDSVMERYNVRLEMEVNLW